MTEQEIVDTVQDTIRYFQLREGEGYVLTPREKCLYVNLVKARDTLRTVFGVEPSCIHPSPEKK